MSIKNNVSESSKLLQKYWPSGKKYFEGTDQFIKRYKNRIIVIKYGGYALTKPHLVKSFAKNIALLNQLGMKVIIVHGGGPQIENQLRKKKIKNDLFPNAIFNSFIIWLSVIAPVHLDKFLL